MFFRRYFVLSFLLILLNAQAVASDNTWSAAYGDVAWDAASDLFVDDGDESVYLIGTFEGTLDLGGETLVSAGSEDIFLAKFDRHGNHVWSQHFGDADAQWGEAIAFNQVGGIVIGGQFQGSVDFGGGSLSAPYQSIFVASLNSDGEHLWSNAYGSWGDNQLEDLDSTMMTGHVYIVCTGSFEASGLDFGGGELPYHGATDAYLVEFDVDGSHRFSGSYGDAAAQAGKAITAYIHSYAPSYVVTGAFAGSIDFGYGIMTASGGLDVFTAAFLPSGSVRWSQQYGGPGDDSGFCIAHDSQGNLFVGGQQEDNGVPVAYVRKYDSDGISIRTLRGEDNQGTESELTGVAITDEGDVLLAGSFAGEIHFFPRGSSLSSIGAGDQDIYMGRWDNDLLIPIFEYGLGGALTQSAAAVDYAEHGAVLTGWFEGTIDFGCGPETSTGDADAFLARFSGHYPVIVAIEDIESDQGRQVRLELVRSDYDRPGSTDPITQFEIFRRIDPLGATSNLAENPDIAMVSSPAILSTDWDYLGAIPAHGDPRYAMVVPTLADSSISSGMYWTKFFVRAATADPYTFYDSEPDSGYSVDNLAPGVPLNFAAGYQAGGVNLDWDDALEEDFQFYRIYRDTQPGFVPAPGNLVQEVASSAWTDPTINPWDYHYMITVLDHAGNESEAGSPTEVSGVQDGAVPARTALLGAVPNPFNPSTKLSFEMATAGHARLKVYDAAGRLVATLVDEHFDAGNHNVIWDGRDHAGRMSSAGVYLYRFEVGGFSETKRMVLVK